MKRKKIIALLSVVIVIGLAVAGLIWMKMRSAKNETNSWLSGMEGMDFGGTNMSGFVAAYGVTGVGTIAEEFPVDNLTVGLEIEEVYVASGEEVNTETAVLKFTEASVAEALEALEAALRDADLAYRASKIEYEQALINAKYDYERTVLAGKQAEAVYQETISNKEESVEKARTAYEEAAAEIAEYEAALANGTYKAAVDACQAEYDENYAILVDYMEEWGIDWSSVTGGGMGGGMQGNSEQAQRISTLKSMYSVLESNAKDLQAAEQEYEERVTNVNITLQTLKLSLPSLSEAYANAQANYESSCE